MSHFDDMMARATRPRAIVPIVLDGNLADEILELIVEISDLERAKSSDKRLASKTSPRLTEARAELAAAHGRAEGATLKVVVEGLAGTAWDAFKASHPMRDVEDDRKWGIDVESCRDPLIRVTAIGYLDSDDETVVEWADGQLEQLIGFATSKQLEILRDSGLLTSRRDEANFLRHLRSMTETSADE